MRKQFKSIAAAILAVLMLMSISMTAMAAEQVPAVGVQSAITTSNGRSVATPASALDDIYNNSRVSLSSGTILTNLLHVTEPSRHIQHKLVGNSGTTNGQTVVFRLKNNATGETRSFTAVADGSWHLDTYNTAFPAGYYTLSVVYVGAVGSYGMNIICLP